MNGILQVPSLSEVNQKNAEQHLEWICNKIPIFRLLGRPVLVKKERSEATIYVKWFVRINNFIRYTQNHEYLKCKIMFQGPIQYA